MAAATLRLPAGMVAAEVTEDDTSTAALVLGSSISADCVDGPIADQVVAVVLTLQRVLKKAPNSSTMANAERLAHAAMMRAAGNEL